MDRLETSMYLKDCMASDKNAIIIEFWDCGKGRWSSFEATRTAPGIAVTRKNKTVRFHENRLTESDRETAVNKAIERYNETTAERENQKNMAIKKPATAKAANIPVGKSESSELNFAMELMNRFGLNDDDVITIMKLCKERYSSAAAPVNKLAEKMAAAGLE